MKEYIQKYWQIAKAIPYKSYADKLKTLPLNQAAFIVIVAIPTFISAFYYWLWASDIFVSETKFSVHVEGQSTNPDGILSLINSASQSSKKDVLSIREYINSLDILQGLQKNIDIESIYSSPEGDVFATITSHPTHEEFLEYYNKMISLKIDNEAGIITLKTRAFTAEDSQKISTEILKLTEEFLNNILNRIRADAVEFSRKQLAEAEQGVIDAMTNLNEFRKSNKNFDPSQASSGVLGIIQSLEAERAKSSADLQAESKFLNDSSFRIKALKKKIASLDSEMESQRKKLIGNASTTNKTTLADETDGYQRLQMIQQFATKRYELALAAHEAAQASASRQNKYITRILQPTLPDSAVEPHRLTNPLTVLITTLLIFLVGGLIISGIRDHIISYE